MLTLALLVLSLHLALLAEAIAATRTEHRL